MNSKERCQVDEARTWDLQEQSRKDHQARMIALVAFLRQSKLKIVTADMQERAWREEIWTDAWWAVGAGHGVNVARTSHQDLVQHARDEARRIEEGTTNNGIPRFVQGTRSYLQAKREEIRKELSSAVGLTSCIERTKRPVCTCDHDHGLFGRRTLPAGYVLTEELLFGTHAHLLEDASLGYSWLNGRRDDAHNLKIRGVQLHPTRSFTARDREHDDSQAGVLGETAGPVVYIDIDAHASQQSDQASVVVPRATNLTETKSQPQMRTLKLETGLCHCWEHSKYTISDGRKEDLLQYIIRRGEDAYAVGMLVADNNAVDVQNFVSTIFGGFVVLSFTNLIGTSKGDYPEFIRLGLYVGYVLLIVLTFLGLTAKKMAKPAMRVAAGMSIAAVTISAVYGVSEKVYIRSFIGILGAIGTLAMAMINWR